MCEIVLNKLYSRNSTSIVLAGTFLGDCEELLLTLQVPGDSTLIQANISIPPGDETEVRDWEYEFSSFSAASIESWCKNSEFDVRVECEKEDCPAATATMTLSCCPKISYAGFQADDQCISGAFNQLRPLVGLVIVENAGDLDDDISVIVSMWPEGSSPPLGSSTSFIVSPTQTTYTAGVDFELYLGAPAVWEGAVQVLTPIRCQQSVSVSPITLPSCNCDLPLAPADFFIVRDSDASIVTDINDTGCINGDYATVQAADFSGEIEWSAWLDDQNVSFTVPDADQPRVIQVPVANDGSRVVVTAVVGIPGCLTSRAISLKKCGVVPELECTPVPDDYSLIVRDDNELVVAAGECVTGAVAWVSAPSFAGEIDGVRNWTLGADPADPFVDNDQLLRVELNDNDEHQVTVTVGQGDCQQVVSRDIQRCVDVPDETDTTSPLCPIFMFLIVLGAGIFALGIVLLCPGLTSLDAQVQFGISLAAIGLGLLITVIAFLLWFFLCEPSKCKWYLLIAKLSFVVGLIFSYAALCPGCGWLGLGVIGFFAFLYFFYLWAQECRPTICTVYIELFLMTLIFDFIWLVEAVLSTCVVTSNPIEAAIFGAAIMVFTFWVTQRMFRFRCIQDNP